MQGNCTFYIYLRGNPLNLIDPTGMAEADPEIAQISPEAYDYINSFTPTERELQIFVDTYDKFGDLTTTQLYAFLLKVPVRHGEYPEGDPDKYNGFYDDADGYGIRLTKRALNTKDKDWKMRIRSTIFHEMSHFLNFYYGVKDMTPEEIDRREKPKYPYPQYELTPGRLTDVYVNSKTGRPTFNDLGKEFEIRAYGKDY